MAMTARGFLCAMAFAAAVTVALGSSSWEPCSKYVNYKVKIKDVLVQPDPVVSGKDATFVIPAKTSVPLDSGKVIITVLFHNIPVHREVDDLCSKTSCPVPPGDFVLNTTQGLPGITPPGSYKIRMQLSQGSSLLACANINFQIVWRSTADQ